MRKLNSPNPGESLVLDVMRGQAQSTLARGGLSEAEKAALELRTEGIPWATPLEIEDRVEANLRRDGARTSQLREILLEALKPYADAQPDVHQPPPKPVGRPPTEPSWLAEVAYLHAQGLTLRRALKKVGILLSNGERKNIYRRKRFRELVEASRWERGLSER